MRTLQTLLIALFAVTFAACSSSADIRNDYDFAVDFSAYQTYKWLPVPDGEDETAQSFLHRDIKRAIEQEMENKSIGLVERGPDLYLIYHVAVDEVVTGTYIDHWGYGSGRYGASWGQTSVDVQSYNKGTLLIDMVDAGNQELVWRGMASGAVKDPSDARKNIDKVVADVLAAFPPKPKK